MPNTANPFSGTAYATEARRWTAVADNDVDADAFFVYAVRTTGIYCRPSCRSRLPRRENVTFHDDGEAARAAGYRPCKRCTPDRATAAAPHITRIARACRLIETRLEAPTLDELADHVGVSAYHFHRLFKRQTGLTPRQYAAAVRDRRLQANLSTDQTVTTAMLDAGFASSGQFYAGTDASLGMTPSRYRDGGRGATIRFAVGECALGSVLVAGTARGVCDIRLGDAPEPLVQALQDRFTNAELIGDDADFQAHVARVVAFVERPAIGLDLPLDIRGTAFQRRVWQALREIPRGETASYTAIAARIGAPTSSRAVAGACAANTLALAIPCHRVVRKDGGLSGYRWGVARKRALLDRERST